MDGYWRGLSGKQFVLRVFFKGVVFFEPVIQRLGICPEETGTCRGWYIKGLISLTFISSPVKCKSVSEVCKAPRDLQGVQALAYKAKQHHRGETFDEQLA